MSLHDIAATKLHLFLEYKSLDDENISLLGLPHGSFYLS